MYCRNCGVDLDGDVKFCPKCGVAIDESDINPSISVVNVHCTSCGAPMQLSDDKTALFCEYCGAKKILVENENVVLERLRNEVKREQQNITSEQEKLNKYRQGVFMRLTIVFAVLSVGGCFVAFRDSRIYAGITAVGQIVLFTLSLLVGNRVLKFKPRWLYIVFGVVGLLMVSLFLSLYNGRLYNML